MKRVLALSAFLLVGVTNVHAQQVAYAANVMTEIDSATQAALNREIGAARDRGLPVEPLIAKIREGRVKGAAAIRIRAAVTTLARRLDSARVALGPLSSADELAAGADALVHGADVAALRTLRAATPRPIAVPIGTLVQLLLTGLDQKRALEMVISLIHKNASPQQMVALGNLVEADVVSGLRPEEAALFRLRGIEGSLGLGTGDKVTVGAASPGPSGGTTNQPPPKPHRKP